ncbi:hypothetical protein [Pantoea sp. BAV 3049]|uniref:hypothetical protein n=1 Tax=Pantoea sp. BAV 3049 TaxID=2654188 RepID=UPI00131BC86E|nr:hypothetical protein [Pantoea sp. BAV 3049]
MPNLKMRWGEQMTTEAMHYFGTDQPVETPEEIALGRWTFSLVSGDLKALRYDGVEVIRSAAFVIRDAWRGTCEAKILSCEQVRKEDHLTIKTRRECVVESNNSLLIETTLTLSGTGPLTFSAVFRPEKNFRTARTGFTVLYPLQGVVGAPVEVVKVSGEVDKNVFPELIEPWQPFKEIRTLSYQHQQGIKVTTDYSGDVFEMEDQRAWSDASYKVYSRPLEKEWPYRIAAGERIEQQLIFSASSVSVPAVEIPLHPPEGEQAGIIPAVGCLLTPELLTDRRCAEMLQSLMPGYLLYHCDPRQHGLDLSLLNIFLQQLRVKGITLPLRIEYVLPVDPDQDFRPALTAFWQQVQTLAVQPVSVMVSPDADLISTPPGSEWPWCPPLEDIYRAAREIFPHTELGGGMISYFTELNRKRPPVDLAGFISHATCPVVHDAADLAVMQTLESLPYITRTTRSFIGDNKPYHLGPGTISMRSNPYGAGVYPNPDNIRLTMTDADPRQRGLFFACWLVGYLAQLQGSGVSHWCPAALCGKAGLQPFNGGEQSQPWPAWYVVRFLAGLVGSRYQASFSGEMASLVLSRGSQRYWLYANLTGKPVRLALPAEAVDTEFSLSANGLTEGGAAPESASYSLLAYQVLCLKGA